MSDKTDSYPPQGVRITNSRLCPGILISEHNPDIPYGDFDKEFVYKMDHGKRGIALIINNVLFTNGMPERQGSEKDARYIEATFKRLGFKVITRKNQSVKSMKQLFFEVGNTDQRNNDCFVCVILSHGEDGDTIFGTDDKVTVEELIEPLLSDKCPSLAGKPKLFFIQACRGSKMDKGEELELYDDVVDSHSHQMSKYPKIPIWADVLIAYSTVPGYYSWRNSLNGSWFIQSLGYVLNTEATHKDLLEMLTKVNYKVAYDFESRTDFPKNDRMKQVPCLASMLTKKLYFYPQ